MTTEFIADADAYTPQEAPRAPVRVDGTIYMARCPKDSVVFIGVNLDETAGDEEDVDRSAALATLRNAVRAVFDEPDAEEILAKVLDTGNRRVTIGHIRYVIKKVIEHYRPHLTKGFADIDLADRADGQEAAPPGSATAARRAGTTDSSAKAARKKTGQKAAAR